MDEIFFEVESSMQSTVDHFSAEMAKVRTGRASSHLLDGVKVEYYGAPTPLAQIASVSVPDARMILVQPFEKSSLAAIERAIMSADLGLNPNNDGSVIRVPVPLLTEERRKEYVKTCGKIAEDSRISVRNSRRDANDGLKKLEKAKEISEDDRKGGEEEVQKLTNKYIKKIDEILEAKQKEIMEV